MICDRKISARVKGMFYKIILRSGVINGLGTIALTNCKEVELEMPKLTMLSCEIVLRKSIYPLNLIVPPSRATVKNLQ